MIFSFKNYCVKHTYNDDNVNLFFVSFFSPFLFTYLSFDE